MSQLARVCRSVPLLLLCPFLIIGTALAAAVSDLLWLIFGKRRTAEPRLPAHRSASVVIPNWNGRDLLARYLPSVIAALAGDPENEIIVADNGSTDGSADFIRSRFPEVRVLALERNLGFGGGSNAGFCAARNDIVVLLNSDMRVERNFLAPLLEGFTDDRVFAVACQILFTDPGRPREETGLTQATWKDGALRVRHRIDEAITAAYPCFYAGGGSSAFDRAKFLELGGFDPLLAPFYLEDTDLGFLAWKRGWKVFFEPRSIVYHEHRGTIGKHFSARRIEAVYRKNFVLFAWKNIHDWRRLAGHFAFAGADALLSAVFGDVPTRGNAAAFARSFLQLPEALQARWHARSLGVVSDTEAFRRPLGGYFRDRFAPGPAPGAAEKLRVLFVSPYPIDPPLHGGAVFMRAAIGELARRSELHLVCLLDDEEQRAVHESFATICASAEFLVRSGGKPKPSGTAEPNAVREFASDDLAWIIHRQLLTKKIDVLQLDYTPMAQYSGDYRHIATALFEHDIYFQSIARGLREPRRLGWKLTASVEYLRALRWELRALRRVDRIQVCSDENRTYLASFLPRLEGKIETGLRASIDTRSYTFRAGDREPGTILFLGSFRHLPNQVALQWFAGDVIPRILAAEPAARLIVAGSEMPPPHSLPASGTMELRGLVADVREPLSRYSVFVCPILGGSGVRVKLLEAFACGIPVVSTRLGAEGVARTDGEICALADDAAGFAAKVIALLRDPANGAEMAIRARREVEARWDSSAIAERLVKSYRDAVGEKRAPVMAGAVAIVP